MALFPRPQRLWPPCRSTGPVLACRGRLLAVAATIVVAAGSQLLGPAASAAPNPYPADPNRPTKVSGPVNWIADFIYTYRARTGRWAIIYTTTDWWTTCTGNFPGFSGNNPLWIARYSGSVGTLPAGWGFYTFWQWADSGVFPGDQNVFSGSASRLLALANSTA